MGSRPKSSFHGICEDWGLREEDLQNRTGGQAREQKCSETGVEQRDLQLRLPIIVWLASLMMRLRVLLIWRECLDERAPVQICCQRGPPSTLIQCAW